LEGANGIDPSLFFDDDGKCYYHGTCERSEGGEYYGDNEIYLQELDLNTMMLIGERHVIWHCALKNAVWPEAPHIYKVGEYYYLLISEGGTAHEHAVTVARSNSLTGYYTGHKSNPILTHRHLGRKYPIVNVGHGDLVETQNGEWWMVLLASRPYGGHFRNLGRETFLIPVEWEDGWPVVNYGIGLLQEEERFPNLKPTPASEVGGFEFSLGLPKNMMFLRNPVDEDYKFITGGNAPGIYLRLNANAITEKDTVSYYCIRQQHINFEASTCMHFDPDEENECAGLVILQNSKYHYQFVLTRKPDEISQTWKLVLQVIKCANGEKTLLAEAKIGDGESAPKCGLYLKITGKEQDISFLYGYTAENYTSLLNNANGRILSTDIAGGFVGATIGMYASANGVDGCTTFARFTEFNYKATV